MITCTRRIHFDAGHRVKEHESQCKYLHGHRYVIEATFGVTEDKLDDLGRVIDFGVIKEKLGAWIDTHWDHTLVLWDQDQELGEVVAKQTGQVVYYMPYNPTAENMARYLKDEICKGLFKDQSVQCQAIRLYETPNCFADC